MTCKKLLLDGKQYNVQLWDTAGQEIFKSTTATYFRNRHCIIFMYDITSRESFDHVEDWMKIYNEIKNEDKKTLLLLVGTKRDLINERIVTENEGMNFADAHDLPFFECSSKEGYNIDSVIEFIVRELRNRKMLEETKPKEQSQQEVVTTVSLKATVDQEEEVDNSCC